MQVLMDRDLPQGQGIVLDERGVQIAVIDVPGGKRPEGAAALVLSIEDYGVYLRAASNALFANA